LPLTTTASTECDLPELQIFEYINREVESRMGEAVNKIFTSKATSTRLYPIMFNNSVF
jgi:hypothetical protein